MREAINQAAQDVLSERKRQISVEGYDPAHDDQHVNGEIALAAACYATPIPLFRHEVYAARYQFDDPWPWEAESDRRPHNGNILLPTEKWTYAKRRDLLVKAAALLIAEIERLDRATP